MLRVGVNTLFLVPGEVGGSETYLRRTLAAMARGFPDVAWVLFTNRENHAVLSGDLAFSPRAACHRLDFRASNRFARIVREQTELPLAAGRRALDVLWSPGYTAPLLAPCPQVTSILDMQYKSHPEDLSAAARTATDVLVRLAARRSRCILTISEFSKREIVAHTSADPENVFPTLLAADPPRVRDDGGEPVTRGGHPAVAGGRPYILCVANTYPHKRVDLLVDAFADLRGRIAHTLVLVGRPRLGEPRVQRALARIPEPGRVVRLSGLSTDDLAALYRGADLFAFPSFYEGFGLPVVEAMAAGTPVVTTRRGAIPEVGGRFVRYADPPSRGTLAERILEVLAWDDARRSRWIREARRHAGGFRWEKTARDTIAVLRRAAATPGRRHKKA